MTSGPQVYAIGDNTLDVYVGTIAGTVVGGNALNVAAQLTLHDVAAEYAGAIGDDEAGRTIAAAIAAVGVGTRDLVTSRGPSAVTTIEVLDSGDRRFASEEFGVTAHYEPEDAVLRRAAEAGWVHIGMLPGSSRVCSRLKEIDPRVVISQDCAVASGTSHLDVAIWSVGPDRRLADETAARSAAAGVPLTIVTMGPAGALAAEGAHSVHHPAVDVDVIDTTGAGDSFIAGLIAARLAGADLTQALDQASRWAAATCSHVGGWPQPFPAPPAPGRS